MSLLNWIDNRTLIACEFLLALVFTIVLHGMKRVYPNLRGINTIALSFLLGVPGSLLIVFRDHIPVFASVMLANFFILAAFNCLYRGILRFVGSRRPSKLPWIASAATLAVLFYSSEIHHNIVPSIVAVSITIGLIRGLIAIELVRKAALSTSPIAMRLFGSSMTFFAAVSFNRAIMTALYGAPSNFLETNFIQTVSLVLGVVSVCFTGLFCLILASSELITRSLDESQRDPLSGAFNRRGIENLLGIQLDHVARGHQRLSVALIDVDRFKSINDDFGHAAGDTAIRSIVNAMSNRLRRYDYLGRYGGDEFLLLLPHTPCQSALVVAERLDLAVRNLNPTLVGRDLTLSMGLTEAVLGDTAETLLARADKALYQAKDDGRGCRRVVLAGSEIAAPEAASFGDLRLPEPGLAQR